MPLKLFRRKPGGPWYIRGTIQGRQIYESTGCFKKAEAEALRLRRETEIQHRHAYGKAATLTFAEAALAYMETGGEPRFLEPILLHFGPDTLLADIDNAAVNEAAKAIYPTAADSTINRQLITPISAIVSMAAAEGLTPFRKFRRRKGSRVRTRWLTPEEAEALIGAAGPHLVPILGVLLGSGMRVSEALNLDVAHFYPVTAEAWVADTKNTHPRMVRMPRRAVDLILTCPLPASGPLLRKPNGLPYAGRQSEGSQIVNAFSRARDKAGLGRDVTPHVCRHTWATWYSAATGDFGTLLDLGGWRNADMAQRYRKIAPRDLADRLLEHGWDFQGTGGGEAERKPGRVRAVK
ncbi:site-specific integrase [Psychromarinibacter sp. C21-152]|uniref:Site-specific integrase n=1 Tax=Psychromarinibacter sediminicola TaxID=3033385 RepID=A0AAE3T945_9RHOB|nr:site-specific integrase [Psychromarinibacter sediminicola]MDF0602135.1 site-specific integrase [Psychromarinibacter sediminicola]